MARSAAWLMEDAPAAAAAAPAAAAAADWLRWLASL